MNKYNITFCKNSIYRGCQNGQSKHMYKIRVAVEHALMVLTFYLSILGERYQSKTNTVLFVRVPSRLFASVRVYSSAANP